MKKIINVMLFGLIFVSCKQSTLNKLEIKSIETFPVNSSIRALEVVNDTTVWFAGSDGIFGFTENKGSTWNIDSIKTENIIPNFRSIAVTDKAVFLLNIASPALLYKSIDKGKTWKIVYRENDSSTFYDAMAFWDDKDGIAMGDPIDNCLSVIITNDGGNSWQKLSCDILPKVENGEAAFAASNSNISLYKDNVWIVTGGKRARIFHSPDKGKTWQVFNTPIIQGGQMTGIFTADFYDESNGIIWGGDWNNKDLNTQNNAITKNGGKTWELLSDSTNPGYRSCVRYVPDTNGKQIIAVGIPGISYSNNGGKNWGALSKESFYTIRFGTSYKTAWVAGNNKIGKIVWK